MSLRSLRSRNGPPLAVKTNFETSRFEPPIRHCQSAECSESTGKSWSGLAIDITRSPPATSDSLLARATRFPTFSAASVGASPIDPVIPFKTTSHVIAAISVEAPGPSITVVSARAPLIKSAPFVTPTTGTLNFLACSIISSGLFPADVIATTRKRFGLAATISSACTPIDPVEPRITKSFIIYLAINDLGDFELENKECRCGA
ncbi:unannotated protein [freshwater metagenome]|uniref:Unannotated protein n=1 Tax=freshwater metagenome TaxID=449393 RepID=A0A6J5ZHZ3_9ZZZZ